MPFASGFNGDTMANVGRRFYEAGEQQGLGIAIEPELMGAGAAFLAPLVT